MKNAHIIYALLAIAGGVVKNVNGYLNGEKLQINRMIANAIVSGFSGYMFASLAGLINPSWVYVAAGIGGYMGAESLTLLINIIKRKMK